MARDAVNPTAKPYADIEPGVSAVVTAIRGAGASTMGSCEGHLTQGRAPYVYFNGSPEIIQQILSAVSLAAESGSLNYRWTLLRLTDNAGLLNWRLTSIDLECYAKAKRYWTLLAERHLALADLDTLAIAVRAIGK